MDFNLSIKRLFHLALLNLTLLESFNCEIESCRKMFCKVNISISALSNLIVIVDSQICELHIR